MSKDYDLELVPTHDLIDEIACRFDNYIFYGLKVMDDDMMGRVRRWGGNPWECIGSAELVKLEIARAIRRSGRNTDSI